DQIFEIELVQDKLASNLVEQFGMARRVLIGWLVDGVDDAEAEEVSPEMVDRGTGKVGIVGRGHPVRQGDARVGVLGELRLLAVEELCLHNALGAADLDLADIEVVLGGDEALALLAEGCDAGEEGGVLPELLPRILVERVIVTLRTFELEAQEQAGRGRG